MTPTSIGSRASPQPLASSSEVPSPGQPLNSTGAREAPAFKLTTLTSSERKAADPFRVRLAGSSGQFVEVSVADASPSEIKLAIGCAVCLRPGTFVLKRVTDTGPPVLHGSVIAGFSDKLYGLHEAFPVLELLGGLGSAGAFSMAVADEKTSASSPVNADLAKRIESLETTVSDQAKVMSEQAKVIAAEKLRVAALEKEALKTLALRLLPIVAPPPLSSPSGSSRSSQSSSASAAQQAAYHLAQKQESERQLALKIAAVDYYGLWNGPHVDGTAWSAHTMIPAAGAMPFEDCIAAHIYPRKSSFPSELAVALALPANFMDDPRCVLVLPKPVEVAYDRQAIVLAPALGRITVWPAFVGRLTPLELANVAPFFGTVLEWPTKAGPDPHYPFMRLLAWACLAVLRLEPPTDPRMPPLVVIAEQAKSASPTAAGNEGVTRLSGGLDE